MYINGQSKLKAQYVWASSLDELNDAAKIKLRLTKPVKFFYTEDGKIVILTYKKNLSLHSIQFVVILI